MLRTLIQPAFKGAEQRRAELKNFLDRNDIMTIKEALATGYHCAMMELELVRLRESHKAVVKRNQKLKTLTEVVEFRNEMKDL